jgi:hypothetical protein
MSEPAWLLGENWEAAIERQGVWETLIWSPKTDNSAKAKSVKATYGTRQSERLDKDGDMATEYSDKNIQENDKDKSQAGVMGWWDERWEVGRESGGLKK